MKTNSCILYFTLSPESEAKRKNWTASKRLNLKIAEKLYSNTLETIESTSIPFHIHDESNQSSTDFGENISKAVSKVFDRGYDQVIVIGNDCPEITKEDISSAYANGQVGKNTIGYTKDGGAFLFTINKSSWSPNQFAALSWCSDRLGHDLFYWLYQQGDVTCLSHRIDIDILQDLKHFANRAYGEIARYLKSLLLDPRSVQFNNRLVFRTIHLTQDHRGPPSK